MVRAAVRAGLILAALVGGFAQAAAPEVPAAAFAALPQVSDVELSPNGKLLAWRDQSGPVNKVMIYDIDTRSYRRSVTIDHPLVVRSVLWADDDTLLVTMSQMQQLPLQQQRRRYTFYRTMSLDVNTGKTCFLLMGGGYRGLVTGAELIAWHTARPHTVIMSTWDYSATAAREQTGTHIFDQRADSGWVGELFRVDTRTGKGTEIDEGGQYADDWVVNADGDPVARSEWQPAHHQYLVEAKSGLGWRQILSRQDATAWTLYGLSSDGKSLIATGPGQDGWVRLWAIALDGAGAKQISPDVPADVVDVIYDHFSGVPTGIKLGGIDPQVHWLDPATQARDESVARAFPGRIVSVYDHSQDGSRVVAEVEDRSHPPVYYLVDFKTHGATLIGEAYPALDNVTLGPVRTLTYPARDGTAIPAYLTLPPGLAPRNLPMVVLPHGGPEASDTPYFDWLAQFLAMRGYAVLQPEFRGSTGFGVAFRRAGRGQWGGLMQDDVTDGVKAMIRQGVADPHRICIVGGSYGGYAALAGAAFTPKLYACVVSINGVSDLPAMLGYEKGQHGTESDAVAYWEGDIGSQFDSKVIDHSPVNSAADVEAPVLLLHAINDTVVPIAQSEEMAKALAALGKPVTFIKLDGEDHWLSNAPTRLEVLEDTDHFLRQHLK
ncbi:MAG: S9 family peptidase [Steroidobacteraceae bacterium]